MINRTLIRLKIVQLVYAYYQNGGKRIDMAEKDLLFSLGKAYELYHIMLLLPIAVTRLAKNVLTRRQQLSRITHKEELLNTRFADNLFVAQLEQNVQLRKFNSTLTRTWDDESAYLNQLYKDIVGSEEYAAYMALPSTDFETDRELWRQLYKHFIMKDERIDDLLEEQCIYWNDDRPIVDTFVLKTIKQFRDGQEPKVPLLPKYKDEGDEEYATTLFRKAIGDDMQLRELIGSCLRNWEFSRLAFMDVVIMQVALAEITSFPLIPVAVSINEYVEIAKYYSTNRSGSYVNGILDAVCRQLYRDGKLINEVPQSMAAPQD